MIETTRPELVAYQEERLAKFVNENQKLDKGQIVFAGCLLYTSPSPRDTR